MSPQVAEELKRIIRESEITKYVVYPAFNIRVVRQILKPSTFREDDATWPKKNIVGRQELEVRVDKEHISFEVRQASVPKSSESSLFDI